MTRYALAQINATVGDLDGNAAKILRAQREAVDAGADLVIYPELTLAGYPPEDLLHKPGFLAACENAFRELAPRLPGAALIGCPARYPRESAEEGGRYNTAAVVDEGRVLASYRKILLPNYAVFDEKRYFTPGAEALLLQTGSERLGVVICEDAWEEDGPARDLAAGGARVVACLSASPFRRGKHASRETIFGALCQRHGVWFLYCNLVGGQDELVFDGGSLVIDPEGRVVARAREFAEDMLIVDLPDRPPRAAQALPGGRPVKQCRLAPNVSEKPPLAIPERAKLSPLAEVYDALVLGLRDYVRKNGFAGVVLGLSGGIDSGLTAAIAVDALGKENVLCVSMPGRYSSEGTRTDAEVLAANLGVRFLTIPIEAPHAAFTQVLEPHFAGVDPDPRNLTDQNLQARVRAVYLMALSNRLGLLVLNTSNKSESAVGYGTLYGDMVGAYAAIKDVFKTEVWTLSRHVNERHGRELIPPSMIERVPSAELRPDQEDRQAIPDYPLLDPILACYIERDMGYGEIVAAGHDPETVQKALALVDRNEFKRRQAVIGTRITPKAFGKDRRMPITNRFKQFPKPG